MTNSKLCTFLLTIFVSFSLPIVAKSGSLYKCTSDDGTYKFTSSPCPGTKEETIFKEEPVDSEDEPIESSANQPRPNKEAGSSSYDAYDEFLTALRRYLNASSDTEWKDYSQRSKRYELLKSAARLLAVQIKTPAQMDNLHKERRRIRKMHEKVAVTEEVSNLIRRKQLERAIKEVERALGIP